MAKDASQFLGLSTDPTGDRLGDQAMDLRNMVPVSPSNIAPRLGTSLVAHYIPESFGRFVFADALPGALANGVLITCTGQTEDDDMPETHGVYDFYPKAIAPSYATVAGFPPVAPADGILNYFLIDVQNQIA